MDSVPLVVQELDGRSRKNFLLLAGTAKKRRIGLMLGAGASASAGLPQWNELARRVCEYFILHWHITPYDRSKDELRSPQNISIALTGDGFRSGLSRQVSEALSRTDPSILSQMIKNCVRPNDWIYLVKKAMYRSAEDGDVPVDTNGSALMIAIAALCHETGLVTGVVNYNFDSLLSEYLAEAGVASNVVSITQQKAHHEKLNIWHPHGCLPKQGGENTELVFTEDEYQKQGIQPYSWANVAQIRLLTNAPCVFVGASMTDANMRRLLWSTRDSNTFSHFAFLPRIEHRTDAQWMCDTLFDDDLQRLNVRAIRYSKYSENEDHRRLPALLDALHEMIAAHFSQEPFPGDT